MLVTFAAAAVPAGDEPAGLVVTWVDVLPVVLVIAMFCMMSETIACSLLIVPNVLGTSVPAIKLPAGEILVLRNSSPTIAQFSGTMIGSVSLNVPVLTKIVSCALTSDGIPPLELAVIAAVIIVINDVITDCASVSSGIEASVTLVITP